MVLLQGGGSIDEEGFLCFKQRNPGVVLLEEVHEVGSWCCVAQVDIGGSHNNSNDLRSPPCKAFTPSFHILTSTSPIKKGQMLEFVDFLQKIKRYLLCRNCQT